MKKGDIILLPKPLLQHWPYSTDNPVTVEEHVVSSVKPVFGGDSVFMTNNAPAGTTLGVKYFESLQEKYRSIAGKTKTMISIWDQ